MKMDKNRKFKSENNREYLLSKNTIIYIPSGGKQTKTQKLKENFLKENGLLDDFQPNLTAVYNPNDLQANLANLRMLLIEVTDECNLACKYCGYGNLYNNYDPRKGKKQNFENIKAIIDYLHKLWSSPLNTSFNSNIVIGFYGGEPLIAFDIIEKSISYIEALNIKGITFSYNMTTNAFLLDKHMDYLVDKKFKLLLSLDGDEACNSYRITKNNKSSFHKINSNILLLKNKYPNYFQENVEFNSVLHNLNSVSRIYTFIKNNYNKMPTISELNSKGVADDKKEKFYSMFKNKMQSVKDADNCTGIT
jgi:uncharacterized protein